MCEFIPAASYLGRRRIISTLWKEIDEAFGESKMKKYWVTFQVGAATTVVVEAESKEDAEEKAREQVETPRLCHHCSDHIDLGDVITDGDVEVGEE